MRSINPKYLVDKNGEKKAVVLTISQYRKIMQLIEDLEDALELDRAEKEARGFRDYKEIRAELVRDGLL